MYRIGVDLGGTNIVAGVIDENKRIVSRLSSKTPVGGSYKDIINEIYSVALRALEMSNINIAEVEMIGVCSPGTVNQQNGNVEFAGNLNFHNVPLRTELEHLFKRPVSVCNDGDAMTYGEFIAGSGKDVDNFVAVVLGTGVGGAVINNGKIINGVNYAVGEIGHMVISLDGEQCNCGRRGCFEAYASATALIRQTKAAMQADSDSIMWQLAEGNLDNVTAKTAFDGARLNDQAAEGVVSAYIRYLACGITNLVNIFQPDVLCIAGGVSNEGEALLGPLLEIIQKERYSKYSENQTKVCTSVLGSSAAIIGAAYI